VTAAAIAFGVAAMAAVAATPPVRALARRIGAYDHALCSRKVHGRPVPRLGGAGMVGAFLAAVGAAAVADRTVLLSLSAEPAVAAGLLAGALVIAALGIYDDLRGADAKLKFTVQFAVAGAMYALGFRIEQVAHPFGAPLELGLLGLPVTMLWIAGVVNAMNLVDGLDGLAAGIALVAAFALAAVSALTGDVLVLVVAVALAGAALGFLFFNFDRASIFMGDTGSMFLGFVLATAAIRPDPAAPGTVALVVPVLALGVPLADTLLAMGRRALRGVPMFRADRGHIHHRLLDLGLTQRQTVLVLYGVSALLAAAGVVLAFASAARAVVVLLAIGALGVVALRRLGFFQFAKTRRVLQARRRNLEMQGHVRRASQALREADTLEEVWFALRFAAWGLGAAAVALRLPLPRALAAPSFTHGFEERRKLLVARFGLDPERPGDAHLELGFDDGRLEIDRDTEIAVEILCASTSDALARVGRPTRAGLRLVDGMRQSGTHRSAGL